MQLLSELGLPFKRKSNEVNIEKTKSKLVDDEPTDSVHTTVVEEATDSKDARLAEEAPESEEAPVFEEAPNSEETEEEGKTDSENNNNKE